MSFSGDLEHLSIIDVVQMMHQGRKTGTLTLRGRRGECRLVFRDGSIVSANHGDNRVLIGRILVEAGAIGEDALQRALRAQEEAGAARRPLIATLIEEGSVAQEAAYRGLQSLIQLVIVDVLTWRGGRFSLDPEAVSISDEFRYFPEQLGEGIQFNAEFLLMEALRIFDERKEAGGLQEDASSAMDSAGPISADDLGLGDVNAIERKIPGVYLGLPERSPAGLHRERLGELAGGLAERDVELLATFLDGLAAAEPAGGRSHVQVIFCGADSLMAYCLDAVCRGEGISILAMDEPGDLEPVIEKFHHRRGVTVLVLDAGEGADQEVAGSPSRLRRALRERFPDLAVIQLVGSGNGGIPLAIGDGAVTFMARPARGRENLPSGEETVRFLRDFPPAVVAHARSAGSWLAASLAGNLQAARELTEPAEVALLLLRAVAEVFPRALTLVVRGEELIAEKGIGMGLSREREPTLVAGARIPLAGSSLLRDVVQSGRGYLGTLESPALGEPLFSRLGAPRHPEILLLPLQVRGRTISLTYGDFGPDRPPLMSLEPWELRAGLAGLALEGALWRRKIGPPAP